MKIIVAGSRTFNDYILLHKRLNFYIGENKNVEIVSGTAKGADQLGERYANEKGFKIKRFPADWDKHGKAAGPIRNKQMAEYGTHCVLFWDGLSSGTKNMIDLAKEYKLNIRIVRY